MYTRLANILWGLANMLVFLANISPSLANIPAILANILAIYIFWIEYKVIHVGRNLYVFVK